MVEKISVMQQKILDLIEISSFNNFDGKSVVRDLVEHKDLWDSVLMIRDDTGIILRDLPENYFNVDTLYILTDKLRENKMKEIIKGWSSDEFGVLSREKMQEWMGSYINSKEDIRKVISVWWD